MYKGWTPEYAAQARGLYNRALELDPKNIEAMVALAGVDTIVGVTLLSDDRAAHLAAAEATLVKALSFAPNHAFAHVVLGGVSIITNRAAQGIAECELALALDHNLASAHWQIGLAKYFVGRGAETETHINEAFRLSPRDILAYHWLVLLGMVRLDLTADVEAVSWFRRGIEANRNYPMAISPLHSRCLVRWMRRGLLLGLDLRSFQALRSVASAMAHRLTIQPSSLRASASMRACAWRGYRKGDVADVSKAVML